MGARSGGALKWSALTGAQNNAAWSGGESVRHPTSRLVRCDYWEVGAPAAGALVAPCSCLASAAYLDTVATKRCVPAGVVAFPARMSLTVTGLQYRTRVSSSSCLITAPLSSRPANTPRARE